MHRHCLSVCFCIALAVSIVRAEDSATLPPIKPIERLLPPKGVDIGKEEREKLEAELQRLTKLTKDYNKLFADLMPDVWVYLKAVRWALDFDEFYDTKKDVEKAKAALRTAEHRYNVIHQGQPDHERNRRDPYDDAAAKPGLVVRGYISDIDDSVQPYGLHIPPPDKLDLTKPVPLLVWLHGRGDKETDLHFIAAREKNKGEFAPDWCITLHPYGRGTIGFKFAGEIDVLDAIESVKKRYKIDEDRVALAGFSMGGAGAWHIGAHYADRFCVVHAGAGFVETAKYNRLTPDKYPAWYEQKLWGWYDVPCYTRNLFNVPVIAYSGELDKQKQAADLMAEAFKAEGRELRHIIGPGVEHKYEAKAKEQVLAEIKKAVEKGRNKAPSEVHLQTRNVRYNRMHWINLQQVNDFWDDTRIDAVIAAPGRIEVTTKNVRQFSIDPRPLKPLMNGAQYEVVIDGQATKSKAGFIKGKDNKWYSDGFVSFRGREPAKIGGLGGWVGPIDDAFLHRYVMIEPWRRKPRNRAERWTQMEADRTAERWRCLFRGEVPLIRVDQFSRRPRYEGSVVLWGDPTSNALIKEIEAELPIKWEGETIIAGERTYSAADHIVVMICRTSLATGYTVLNSGPTFREGHDRTNSQQTPKLPDWAIIGLDKDPDAFAPGEIKAAGFFDENWQVKKEEK